MRSRNDTYTESDGIEWDRDSFLKTIGLRNPAYVEVWNFLRGIPSVYSQPLFTGLTK